MRSGFFLKSKIDSVSCISWLKSSFKSRAAWYVIFLLCPIRFGSRKVQIIALAGIIMVNGIILSEIKIKIDDFRKASKSKNTAVKVPSVI